jgi:hypothetical protein
MCSVPCCSAGAPQQVQEHVAAFWLDPPYCCGVWRSVCRITQYAQLPCLSLHPFPGLSPQDEQRLLWERHLVEDQHHVQVLRRAPAHVHILQAAPGLVDARRGGIQPPPAVWVGAEVFMVADL